MNNRSPLYLAMLPLLAAAPLSHGAESLAPVVVTASGTEYRDIDAPFASEVYTSEQIAASGATTLYDFLSQQSSLTVTPSFGNTFTQLLDMRGYGIGNGYQNIVVTLDGRRLNNIDMAAPLLGAIPLASIERIEITKGSGSVALGDGATAGAIRIHTRDMEGATLRVAAGNHGAMSSALAAGITDGKLSLNVNGENQSRDGFSDPDVTGQRDSSTANNLHVMARWFPGTSTELRLGKDRSRIDTTYISYLTQAEFDSDPAQNGGNTYTQQALSADGTSFGVTSTIAGRHRLNFDHYQEKKASDYLAPFPWQADYDNRSNSLSLRSSFGALTTVAGVQGFTGTRTGTSDETSKRNGALFVQGDYRFGDTTLAVGGRRERVRYEYQPVAGTDLEDELKLSAADVGVNHRVNDAFSLFANYNYGFQAPDIDRFFAWGGTFNAFIAPERVRTLNVGANLMTAGNKLKATLFRASLRNEIYYDPLTWTNTNIDRSYKYGVELQEAYRFSTQWNGRVNYTWTRALIDSEDQGGGSYDGKELPGVARHTLTAELSYAPDERNTIALGHNYRSSSYAANDFTNSFAQHQAAYNSTQLRYGYRIKNNELFVKVDNLFNRHNGLWVSDDVIYPVNFTRNWLFGMSAKF
jgi:iron complex outermembrane receptor protein